MHAYVVSLLRAASPVACCIAHTYVVWTVANGVSIPLRPAALSTAARPRGAALIRADARLALQMSDSAKQDQQMKQVAHAAPIQAAMVRTAPFPRCCPRAPPAHSRAVGCSSVRTASHFVRCGGPTSAPGQGSPRSFSAMVSYRPGLVGLCRHMQRRFRRTSRRCRRQSEFRQCRQRCRLRCRGACLFRRQGCLRCITRASILWDRPS